MVEIKMIDTLFMGKITEITLTAITNGFNLCLIERQRKLGTRSQETSENRKSQDFGNTY